MASTNSSIRRSSGRATRRKARPRHRRRRLRQDAVYARRRSAEKRLSPVGPAVDGRADSGAGVAFTSDRLEPGSPWTRGLPDCRLGSDSEQPRLHSSLSTGRPADRLGAAALSGQGRKFLPAHGAAAPGRRRRRSAATGICLRARRVGVDEWLSVEYRQAADARSGEGDPPIRYLQRRRVCRPARRRLRARRFRQPRSISRARWTSSARRPARAAPSCWRRSRERWRFRVSQGFRAASC